MPGKAHVEITRFEKERKNTYIHPVLRADETTMRDTTQLNKHERHNKTEQREDPRLLETAERRDEVIIPRIDDWNGTVLGIDEVYCTGTGC
jgi:hypothetical protein